MIAHGDLVTRLSRDISPEDASGEFTGVMKLTREGAAQFLDFFDQTYTRLGHDDRYTDGRPFRMAYLIHLLDNMIRAGIKVHTVSVPGNYHEIDTIEDYHLASKDWERFASG